MGPPEARTGKKAHLPLSSGAINKIDFEISEVVCAGFDYEIRHSANHFSYDRDVQQNFADTANVCLLKRSGTTRLPDYVTWNGCKDGEFVRLMLSADEFISLYVSGALAHKNTCMEEGGRRKAELSNRLTCLKP